MRSYVNQPLMILNLNEPVVVVCLDIYFLTSLDMSEVDPVWAWGGQTSTPPGSKYFSEIFSPFHIKLTNNNPNKDFKSVERP